MDIHSSYDPAADAGRTRRASERLDARERQARPASEVQRALGDGCAPPTGVPRDSGLAVIGEMAWGTHFCQFYQAREDLLDILVPYFRAGLENNEFCMWIASQPLHAAEAKTALASVVPDLDQRMAAGQIEILDYHQWYVLDGKFDADRVLCGWVDKLEAALRRGFEGLRLTGNTFWLEEHLWKDFSDYEAAVDSVIGRYRMLALCTYSLDKCGIFQVMDVVRNHQFALIRRGEKWEVLQSMQRQAVETALHETHERLQLQTEELQTANEELQAQAEELQAANEELRDRELALRESEERYRRFFDEDLTGDFLAWPDGTVIECNPAFAGIYGYTDVAAAAHANLARFNPEDWVDLMARLKIEREVLGHQCVHRRPDGMDIHVVANVVGRLDETGELREVKGYIFDDTERKRAEEQLVKLNRTLRALNNSSQALVRATDESAYLRQVCRIIVEDCGHAMVWIGYAEQDEAKSVRPVAHAGFEEGYLETLQITWADTERGRGPTGTAIRTGQPSLCRNMLTDPRFAPWREQAIRRGYASSIVLPLLSGGQAFGAITIYSRQVDPFSKDELDLLTELATDLAYGITFLRLRAAHAQMEERLRRLNDELEGEVQAQTEELKDTVDRLQEEVDRRVLVEDTLRRRSQMLEAFFQHTITPLAFMDRHFNFVRVNEAYAKADSKEPEYFTGKNHFALYPHEENRQIFEQVARTRQPYLALAKPFTYPDAPHRVTYWNWLLTPLLDEHGEVQFLVLNLEDVTGRQKAFQELEQRAHQLQKLTLELSQAEDRERKRLAEILHDDLQQQLAAAKFHLSLLGHRVPMGKAVRDAIAQLDQILKDAIEKSRSLSHELSPAVLYQSDLGEAFEWLARQLKTKHGLTVHVESRGRIDPPSEALKVFLFKTAREILFNVVKHARVREARLRIQHLRGGLWLTISDQGQGFDPRLLGKAGGFGLLSIRERIELLGGRMRIRSAKGRGSTFLIVVPDGQKREDGRQTTEDGLERTSLSSVLRRPSSEICPPSSALRVLLVDDHKVMREGLAALLNEQSDLTVVGQAGNGREAVDLACRLGPDVVVIDVAMPLMSGEEATRQIKLQLPHARVVALSMFEEADMAEAMRQAGAEAYLLKTAPSDELLAAIRGRGQER